MRHSISAIAQALGAEAAGDLSLTVDRASEPASAGPQDLALAMDQRYAEGIAQGRAQAAVVWPGADWQALGLKAAIFAPRGRLAMAGLTRMMDEGPFIAAGIHPMSVVDPSAQIGAGAAIAPFVVIGAGAVIGPNARIASHVSIGAKARIGADALILQGSHIGARVTIGDRFICAQGVVIGGDGFSFVTPEKSGIEQVRETLGHRDAPVDQSWTRIHSLGAVTIGDDVEIGANSCIDRGTIRDTRIGDRTKIDDLVMIAHNVEVGSDTLLCGQVGIAGSTKVGNRVVMAGQVGVGDNLFVGDDVIAGGGSKIMTNAPAGRVLLGYPAIKMETELEIRKSLRRLPRFMERMRLSQTSAKPTPEDEDKA